MLDESIAKRNLWEKHTQTQSQPLHLVNAAFSTLKMYVKAGEISLSNQVEWSGTKYLHSLTSFTSLQYYLNIRYSYGVLLKFLHCYILSNILVIYLIKVATLYNAFTEHIFGIIMCLGVNIPSLSLHINDSRRLS